MSRYLSTQERVDLAVTAGHTKAVMEHIRMHNAKGEGSNQLSVHVGPGNTTHFLYLEQYALAAIDSYLTSLGITLYGDGEPAKPSMLSMEHLHYANHCHEQAAYFQQHQGKTLSGTLFERNEFAAIHVAFSMIEEIVIKHPHEIHLATVIHDDVDNVTMLKLSNGRVICRGEAEEARPGVDAYGYFAYEPRDKRSVDDILNLELNELADILHDKGLGLN